RPLYDYGMLERAKRYLRTVLDALRDDIRSGTPVIGLEPSCVAVFRDELVNLFPHDPDAQRFARLVRTLGEHLRDRDFELPSLERNALVHGHCHQKALSGMAADVEVLQRAGVRPELLDSGCCGMAGSFGF